MKTGTILLPFLCVVLLCGCVKKYQNDTTVYFNDFETGKAHRVTHGAKISSYNSSNVLGRFSSGGFILNLDSLPEHSYIEIEMDLYIHDSWDGNSLGPSGPDIFIMDVDDQNAIYATMSNFNCASGGFCFTQSYPVSGIPFAANSAQSNAIRTNLPPACTGTGSPGTTHYKISRTYIHQQPTFKLGCFAQLEHDVADWDCDESWSVDNIRIRALNFK
jgi:hypothetical protein